MPGSTKVLHWSCSSVAAAPSGGGGNRSQSYRVIRNYHHRLTSRAGLQWLPSEVTVADNKAKFTSDITDLHPTAALHGDLEDLLTLTIPLFEAVLTELGTGSMQRERPLRIDPRTLYRDADEFVEIPGFDDRKLWEHYFERDGPNLRHLQVVVKITSLDLAPGETYAGGKWHVDGLRNDHIVAGGSSCVESVNVQGGDLEFRTAVREPEESDVYILKASEMVNPSSSPGATARHLNPGSRLAQPSSTASSPSAFLRTPSPVARPSFPSSSSTRPSGSGPPLPSRRQKQRSWLRAHVNAFFYPRLPGNLIDVITDFLTTGITYPDAVARRSRLIEERRAEFDLVDFFRRQQGLRTSLLPR